LNGASDFVGRDVISVKDFTREEMEFIFDSADEVRKKKAEIEGKLKGKMVALLFFEPSTRTYSTFQIAAESLGCRTVGFQNPADSSVSKGETLHDTLKMFEGYGVDCFVIRHSLMGAAKFASEVTSVPVINAGDGSREHPTQAMLDCYAIRQAYGRVDGLKVGMLGDLKYGRTASSLCYALSNYSVGLTFIAPDALQIRQEVDVFLKNRGIHSVRTSNLTEAISDLDVLYVTRIQKERIPDPTEYERVKGMYLVNRELLRGAKKTLKVMHPLPRVDELSSDVDDSGYAYYFLQAAGGLPLRMALLDLVIGGE
jgi:aspartate carbamoyltransferase catalytic subunit